MGKRLVAWSGIALWAVVSAASPLAAQDCAQCHEEAPTALAETVHGFLECADCHSGAGDFPHSESVRDVECATCHDEVVERYRRSIHGRVRERGVSEAPDCQACHGPVHALLPRTTVASPVHPTRLAETCGSCHADPEMVAKFGIPVARPLEAYRQSVHARAVEAGGPTCSDCHDSHGVFAAGDPRSTVFHQRVPETCGRCHTEITEQYRESVHGLAAAHGAREAPVCTDCHGEHRILSSRERGSPVYATNVPKMTCGRCHGDLRLADKFGIAHDKVPAYQDSYHGLASRAGRITVAHCASCHGVHDILPSSDPRSHTHRENLPATCGRCHPGAGRRFAIGPVHVLPTERAHAAVYWVRRVYLWLIWATVAGMLLHNGLDFVRKLRSGTPRSATDAPAGERMPRGFRIAHALLVVSFAVLVWSGFALTYPEAWWARPLLMWEESLGFRGWLHRGAAMVLLGALAFHLVHIAVDRRARSCIARMKPSLEDLREFRERLGYSLGRREHPPLAPQVDYAEKVEYLALMWGLVVMSVTGFLLWFDNLLLSWLPKWVGDVATVIHFYEAVLATLAILVWHFYFVIFDPVVYPMDPAWLTGRSHPNRAAERRANGEEPRRPATDSGRGGDRRTAAQGPEASPDAMSGA